MQVVDLLGRTSLFGPLTDEQLAQVASLCSAKQAEAGAVLEVVDVDHAADPELRLEYGDRLPVVLLDGEEHSCWEVDDEELRADLARPEPFTG